MNLQKVRAAAMPPAEVTGTPWQLHEPTIGVFQVIGECEQDGEHQTYTLVCELGDGPAQRGNAVLIVTAPILLKACKLALPHMTGEMYQILADVIATAEGRL